MGLRRWFERSWPWLPAAWLLAAMLAWTAPFAALERWWKDFGLRRAAPADEASTVLVVDIDEASMRQLAPALGPWPFPRDAHAAVAQRLFELGAKAVVFNLLFADARTGDEALPALAARSLRPIVLAAEVSDDTRAPGDAAAAQQLGDWAWKGAAWPAQRWSSVVMPASSLWGAGISAGVQRVALDDDGHLRCASLVHEVQGQRLPSLVLAALVASGSSPVALAWPGAEKGCVLPLLATQPDAVPTLAYATVHPASPTLQGDATIAAQIRGRTVFVGGPSVLDAAAMTPAGQIAGTWWQALAFDALGRGRVMSAPSPWLNLGLLLLASLPLVLSLARPQHDPRRDGWAVLAAAATLTGLAIALLAFAQPSAWPAAMLVLLCCGAAMVWREQRRGWAQRQQAMIDRTAAQAAERATSEFLAQMSHEIRTPLNAMIGVAQLLSETPLSPLQRRYVETFGHAGAHLTRLIDEVLDLSRLEARGVELEHQPFALRALAAELQALFEPSAQAKGLRFTVAVDGACASHVLGDMHRVRQVLINLLGNAMKFTPSGAVSLEMIAAPRGAGNSGIECVVSDTGIGIAAERLKAVFEPFTQGDAGVAKRFGGSGLGLAITRRLVQALGGEISLDSASGAGTKVRVWLPLVACATPAADPALAGQAEATLAGRRVLLAEDNEVNVMVVQGMLMDSGVQLDIARDGREAVELASTQRYDLILMDLLMPHLDGHAATRAIRADEMHFGRSPVPVVALSANTQPGDVQESLAAGCVAHLGKPVDKAVLMAALRKHMAPRRAQPAGDGELSAAALAPPPSPAV